MAFADKAKKLIKQRAFLFKLLLTIAGFICIPMIALQIFLIGQSTDEFQKSNQEYYLSVLQTSAQNFKAQKNLLSRTALQLSLDKTIQKPMRHNATEYSQFEAAEVLNDYVTSVIHVNQAGIYYASNEYLLINGLNFVTGGIKYTVEEYCAKYTASDPRESERMAQFIIERNEFGYYAAPDGTLLAARPISLSAIDKNDAVAFFVIDAQALEQSYCTSISLHASFAIVNSQGQFLIRGEDFRSDISEAVLSEFLASGQSVCTAGEDGKLAIYRYTDQESGLVYLLSVNKNESEQNLVAFAKQVRTTMLLTLALVCISLTVTIYINYRPLHRLLEKHSPKENDRGIHSELELLDSAFFALDERSSTQETLLMDFILGDLLFGNAVKQELVDQYFSSNQYHSYVVVSALGPAFTTAQSRILANSISEMTGYTTHITRVPYRPHTVFVCLSKDLIDPSLLTDRIASALADITDADCAVSIGEVVTDIYALRSSYRSSLTADSGIAQEEASMNTADFTKKLQFLVQCVYVGDETEALKHLDEIRHFICTALPSAALRRYYGYKVVSAYLTSINNNEAHLSGKNVEMLLSFTGTENLFELLRDSIHQVCSQVVDTERTVDQQLSQRLLQYVDDNFRNSELCLTAAADHLDTSIYAVSRLFKEITGRGFKDYVTEKRLEYGHMLLCTTQNSVAEVSAAAGFENANYFSTVFKLKYGLPPTKYRKMLSQNPVE